MKIENSDLLNLIDTCHYEVCYQMKDSDEILPFDGCHNNLRMMLMDKETVVMEHTPNAVDHSSWSVFVPCLKKTFYFEIDE